MHCKSDFRGRKDNLRIRNFISSGLPLDFSEQIHYESCVSPSKFSPKDEMFLSVEIKNLFHKGIVKECQHEEGE